MATKSLLFVLGVLQFVLLLKGVTSVQRFEKQPSYTEVNPGQNVELSCKVYNKKGSCSWQKDNKPVGMYLHKYEWSGSHEAGDCSLLIRVAQLEFDDGFWECQVTASDFTTQDALTSQPVRLVVRVPPQQPRIEYNGSQVLPGHNLTSLHGDMATIKCVARYGNPPAVIKWFLDQNEITPTRSQTNSTELDNPRTWVAISLLELPISKENHGKTLRCVALHESYSTRSSSVEVRLNVMFVPESRLIGIPTHDIEELKDSVAVRCVVTSNPRATVIWRRAGQTQPAALQELLQFSPAVRQHAGLYTCSARNQAGEAQPVTVHIDVKYSPKILSVGPDRLTTAPLFTPATFECIAEGNPQPTYQWLQRLPTPSDVIVERGRESKLHIANVTYDYQGEYVCKVTNVISGIERTVQSEAIALQVVGAPQVLRQSTTHEIRVEKGENAMLSLVVCADPRPQVVAWEWGSYRLEAGSEHGRYRVDDVTQDDREDCYVATLHIDAATATDSRAYYLAVENDKGTDRHAVQLYVNEPLQMSTLVSIAGGCLAVFLLLVCACVYAIRSEKCCFARKGDFKPSDLDSEKLDLEKNATGPGGIPADAIYTTTPGSRSRGSASSPEVMKHPTLTYKTSSGFIEDRLSDVISGVENRQKSRTLPTRPADEHRETDNETETGFRISRHLIGADNRYWDVNRYCTIQNPKINDKCILPHEKYSDLATDNHYERNATRYRSNKPNQTLAQLNKSGVVSTTSAMITTTSAATTTTPTTATNQKSHRPKPFQVHDNERYYNHVFSLKPQRSLTKNIYCNDYFQPDSLDRAEI